MLRVSSHWTMRHIGQDVPKRHTHFVLESRLMYEKSFRDEWMRSLCSAVANLDEPLASSVAQTPQRMIQRKVACFQYNQFGLFTTPYYRLANVDRYYAVQGTLGTREWVPYINLSSWTMNKMVRGGNLLVHRVHYRGWGTCKHLNQGGWEHRWNKFYVHCAAHSRIFYYQFKMNAIYRVGSRCSKKVIIKPEEVIKFGKMIEDYNPIHSDPKAAKAAGFDQCICYGMLVGSMFSGLIATEFPHSVYLSQKLRFVSPVFVGDELNVWAEILAFRKSKGLIAFRTVVEKPSKTSTSPIVVVDGSAVMMNKGVKFEGESEWTGDY